MSTHTPGPWSLGEIAPLASFAAILRNNAHHDGDWVSIDAPSHESVAVAVWRMEDDAESPAQRANARLIAAAPEMLDALRDLLAMCERQKDFNDDGDGLMFDRVLALIARIEGEAT